MSRTKDDVSLDERIAQIRRKNVEIMKRRIEIDEDIKNAEERNATIRSTVIDDDTNSEHNPPSLYSDVIEVKKSNAVAVNKNNVVSAPIKNNKCPRDDALWREERRLIDESRINRQKRGSGVWSREWDANKEPRDAEDDLRPECSRRDSWKNENRNPKGGNSHFQNFGDRRNGGWRQGEEDDRRNGGWRQGEEDDRRNGSWRQGGKDDRRNGSYRQGEEDDRRKGSWRQSEEDDRRNGGWRQGEEDDRRNGGWNRNIMSEHTDRYVRHYDSNQDTGKPNNDVVLERQSRPRELHEERNHDTGVKSRLNTRVNNKMPSKDGIEENFSDYKSTWSKPKNDFESNNMKTSTNKVSTSSRGRFAKQGVTRFGNDTGRGRYASDNLINSPERNVVTKDDTIVVSISMQNTSERKVHRPNIDRKSKGNNSDEKSIDASSKPKTVTFEGIDKPKSILKKVDPNAISRGRLLYKKTNNVVQAPKKVSTKLGNEEEDDDDWEDVNSDDDI